MEYAEQSLSPDGPVVAQHVDKALEIWRAGVAAVEGDQVVRSALQREDDPGYDSVLAVGKAASAMLLGAVEFLPAAADILLVTKEGHVNQGLLLDPRIRVIESGHPMPNENSLVAGQAVLDFVESRASTSRLLVLVSGGASALVEKPGPGLDLDGLKRLSDTLLADGYSIDQINTIRIAISRIKGGRLLRRFPGRETLVLGISDIPGDDAALIGSGIGALSPPKVSPFKIPGWIREIMDGMPGNDSSDMSTGCGFRFRSALVGSNRVARAAAEAAARNLGLEVVESVEILHGDVGPLAVELAARVTEGGEGVYIWGGEPTVKLPQNPGQGGRNQSLALALSIALGGSSRIAGVVAGTDGTDGPTVAAGGIVGAISDDASALAALARADAGSWLQSHKRLFQTGPTGTNVMDLAILIKSGGQK
jgi:hydroxypyruvate reductase